MTYKLVPHESGKYIVEFDNGGCRPATDVEVELFKQRDELLTALDELMYIVQDAIDQRSAKDLDSFTLQPARAAIASVKGETK